MLSSSLAPLFAPSARSSELLAGTDLLSSTAIPTSELAHLGPLPSIESLSNDLGANEGVTSPQPAVDLANHLVRDVHAELEALGHQYPSLNEPIHDLTNFGGTIGLGHLGEPGPLLTDTLGALAAPQSGNGAASLVDDTGKAIAALGEFGDVAADATGPGGVIGSGGLVAPITGFANSVVLDFHNFLEFGVGHQVPVINGPIHGLTNLGETIGLGHLGTPGNILTDTINLPGALLSGGGLGSAIPVLHDLEGTVSAADTLVQGVLHAGEGLVTPNGPLAPVTNLANAAVIDVHAALEQIGHEVPVLNGPLHALTGLGETVGLGHLGQSGTLLTDVANLPGEALNGHGVPALEGVVANLGHVVGATEGLAGSLSGAGAGGLAGDLVGAGQTLQPVADVANGVVDGVHGVLEQVGHDVPILNQPIHDVIDVGTTAGLGAIGEGHNLVTDVVNLPTEALAGNGGQALGGVVADAGTVAGATGGVVGSVAGAATGALPGDLVGAGQTLQPVADVANGVVDGVHGVLEQVGHDVPIHDVIDVGTTAGLGAIGEGHNLVTDVVNLPGEALSGTLGDHAPLGTSDLLGGDSLHLPVVSQTGGDALVGKLADLQSVGSGIPAVGEPSHDVHAQSPLPLDFGGDAHVQHTDAGASHNASSSGHLLGL